MSEKTFLVIKWMFLFYVVSVFWGPHALIYACSDGQFFGSGCSVAESYSESLGVATLAWIFGIPAIAAIFSVPIGLFFWISDLVAETKKHFFHD